MSDPLSITVGVTSLVATAINVLQTFQTCCSKYNFQNLAAISVNVQCNCVNLALNQIQTTLLNNPQMAARLSSDESLSGQQLNSVLGACELTFAILVDRLLKLNRSLRGGIGTFLRRDRLERLWNETDIVEISQNISRLSEGLTLLLTALNLKSVLEVQQILTSPRASIILEQVVDDAGSIYASNCSISYVSDMEWNAESRSDLYTTIDPKNFTFDQELLMTRAYQKVQKSQGLLRKASMSNILPIRDRPQNFSKKEPVSRKPPLSISCAVVDRNSSAPFPTENESTKQDALHKRGQSLRTHPRNLKVSRASSILPIQNITSMQLQERTDNLKPMEGDRFGKIEQQNSLNARTTNGRPKVIETQCDVPKGIADNSLDIHGSSKEITLKDFIPKHSELHHTENKLGEIQTFVNLPQHRHQLYVTNTEVTIMGRGVTEIPDNAIAAVHLTIESLLLHQNKISHLPPSISLCKNLTYLNLTENNLTEFPLEVCSIKSIKTLALAANTVTKIPIEIQNLTNLTFLNIASNRLKALPTTLMSMDKLITILAHGNCYREPVLQEWQKNKMGGWSFKDQETATSDLKSILKGLSELNPSDFFQAIKTDTTGEIYDPQIAGEIQSTVPTTDKTFKWPEFDHEKSKLLRARAQRGNG